MEIPLPGDQVSMNKDKDRAFSHEPQNTKIKWCYDLKFYWVANPLKQLTSSFEKDITDKMMSLKRRSM
jgi:hypothetical protein